MNTMESPAPNAVAYVATIPSCDLCPKSGPASTPAVVDAKTFQGPWASMCDRHWRTWSAFPAATQDGDPELGTGKGQRYSTDKPAAESRDAKRAALNEAMASGDIDAAFDIVGDGDFEDYL